MNTKKMGVSVWSMHAYARQNSVLSRRMMHCFIPELESSMGFQHCQNFAEVVVDPNRNSWNSIIVELVECRKPAKALSFYKKMKEKEKFCSSYVSLLKACTMLQDLETGIEIHDDINGKGLLDRDIRIGGALIDMYVKCGFPAKAQEIFNKLEISNVVLWTSLIGGYVRNGQDQEALDYVHLMLDQGIFLDPSALVCILSVFGHASVVGKGQEIHIEITKKGLVANNVIVGTALLNMYMKCGFLAEAFHVFNRLPSQNIVSWTTLISGYTENGHGEDALRQLSHMHMKGIALNAVAFVCILKACGSTHAVERGQAVHMDICKLGFEHDLAISNTLIDVYGKFGLLETAQVVFDRVSKRSVVSWNALLTGYAEFHLVDEVLYHYDTMQHAGVSPSIVTYMCCLKSCSAVESISYGQKIHSEVVQKGFEKDRLIGSILIDMYAKYGCMAMARDTFNTLQVSDTISWNALIRGYVDYGCGDEALYFLEEMQKKGIIQNPVTYSYILKACSCLGIIDRGKCIHSEIVKRGLENELVIGNMLIDMYGKSGSFQTAEQVFVKLKGRDLVSWNTLISGYVDCGDCEKVFTSLEQMQIEGVPGDAITLTSALRACGVVGVLLAGQKIHLSLLILGLEHEIISGSTLVDTYAKCGSLVEAKKIFEMLPYRTIVAWNALILGYIEDGQSDEALNCLNQMQRDGILFDSATILSCLKACGSLKNISKGQEMHEHAIRQGLERECLVGNTLVDMYAKCGLPLEAEAVFDSLINRDVISWTALITGYVDCGHSENALDSFRQMQREGVPPNAITGFANLKACGNVGAVNIGREIHKILAEYGLEKEPSIINLLVDMYSKFGLVLESSSIFSYLPCQEIGSWNALIAGYTHLGDAETVLHCVQKMGTQNVKPDSVTFMNVLNVCNHAGLVDMGCTVFGDINTSYSCVLILEHYTCMIDLLGRAGHIEKALVMIKEMPFIPDDATYQAALGACQKQGNLELGKGVFQHAILSDENHTSAYVCMANIYAHAENG